MRKDLMYEELKSLDNELRKYRLIHIHPVWYSFIMYCESLKYGEIKKIKIQDGVPVFAEEAKRKIKFTEKKQEKNSKSIDSS